MFELRAENNFDDHEICRELNAMGFRTPTKNRWDAERKRIIGKTGGRKLTPKMLQSFIRKTAYCGVICEKWTHYQAVRTPYEGLVSIDLFNQANRGKVFIQQYDDGSLEVLYDQKPQRIIKHRSKHNAAYPFRHLILCPYCRGIFKGSASKGKSGKHYMHYHCSRGHKYYGVAKQEFEGNVSSFLKTLEFSQQFKELLDERLIKVFRKNQAELSAMSSSIHTNIADLEAKMQQAIEKILETQSPVVQRQLEERVEALEQEIKEAKKQRTKNEVEEDEVNSFLKHAKHFMEHIDEMLINTTDMHAQRALFGLVFVEYPTYDEILSGTPKLSPVFATKKTSRDEKSLLVTPRGVEPRLQA